MLRPLTSVQDSTAVFCVCFLVSSAVQESSLETATQEVRQQKGLSGFSCYNTSVNSIPGGFNRYQKSRSGRKVSARTKQGYPLEQGVALSFLFTAWHFQMCVIIPFGFSSTTM